MPQASTRRPRAACVPVGSLFLFQGGNFFHLNYPCREGNLNALNAFEQKVIDPALGLFRKAVEHLEQNLAQEKKRRCCRSYTKDGDGELIVHVLFIRGAVPRGYAFRT